MNRDFCFPNLFFCEPLKNFCSAARTVRAKKTKRKIYKKQKIRAKKAIAMNVLIIKLQIVRLYVFCKLVRESINVQAT